MLELIKTWFCKVKVSDNSKIEIEKFRDEAYQHYLEMMRKYYPDHDILTLSGEYSDKLFLTNGDYGDDSYNKFLLWVIFQYRDNLEIENDGSNWVSFDWNGDKYSIFTNEYHYLEQWHVVTKDLTSERYGDGNLLKYNPYIGLLFKEYVDIPSNTKNVKMRNMKERIDTIVGERDAVSRD